MCKDKNNEELFWEGVSKLETAEYLKAVIAGKISGTGQVKSVDWDFYVEMIECGRSD